MNFDRCIICNTKLKIVKRSGYTYYNCAEQHLAFHVDNLGEKIIYYLLRDCALDIEIEGDEGLTNLIDLHDHVSSFNFIPIDNFNNKTDIDRFVKKIIALKNFK